jgi:hypothetical protein
MLATTPATCIELHVSLKMAVGVRLDGSNALATPPIVAPLSIRCFVPLVEGMLTVFGRETTQTGCNCDSTGFGSAVIGSASSCVVGAKSMAVVGFSSSSLDINRHCT